MPSQYERSLAHYGLTDDQYRRAVAAHELAHGLIGTLIPSLDVHAVELFNDHNGVHGGTYTSTAPGYRTPDPQQHAVELYAGAVAKERWLREQERRWSSDLERLVHACAQGDRDLIAKLGLSSRQQQAAQRDAVSAVARQWGGITEGVPRLVKRGRLSARQLRRLAR